MKCAQCGEPATSMATDRVNGRFQVCSRWPKCPGIERAPGRADAMCDPEHVPYCNRDLRALVDEAIRFLDIEPPEQALPSSAAQALALGTLIATSTHSILSTREQITADAKRTLHAFRVQLDVQHGVTYGDETINQEKSPS